MPQTRVLIVDDDPIARQLYRECLEQAGHRVRTASDASAAAEALDAEPADVVVTDLILPDRDGLAVLAEARARDPGVEVIVITAVERVDPAVRAIKSGAADYLVKPVPPEVLQLSVSRCVATRQLLNENALLRQHMGLLETGQRLATTLDRDQLFPMAVHAFAETLLAPTALLLARRSDGQLALAAHHGLTAEDAERLGSAAAELVTTNGRPALLTVGEHEFRALYGEASGQLACACLVRAPTADVVAWTNANFLARHFALAVHNLNRLSAAEDLAFLDDLTRLHNLRYLQAALDREITNSRQTSAPFSVLFIDLDHFKQVNDTHGHLAGSMLLVEMAGLLRKCVRDIDVAARYGGDEYVILLLGTDSRGAIKVAERIRRTIESHRFLAREGLAVQITACIGAASFPEHAADKERLLEIADCAMYRGKETTRNAVFLGSPGDEPLVRTA